MHFQSFFLPAHIKRRYLVRLWTPHASAPKDGYPLLIMLDGDWVHPSICKAIQSNHELPFAIASLGFHLDRPLARQRRTFEYTPVPPAPHRAIDPRRPTWKVGGALQLQQFIQQQLIPNLSHQLSLNLNKTGLYGHSYGGLFVLYSLLTTPGAFGHYIAASPSLWWYRPFMQELASTLSTSPRPIQIDLLIGEQEQWRPLPASPDAPRPAGIPTIQFLNEFCNNLPTSPLIQSTLHHFSHADHGAMLALSAEFAIKQFGSNL